MGRHRLVVDSDVVAGVAWWGAIVSGLVLLGMTAQHEIESDPISRGVGLSVPDTGPAAHSPTGST
ncbi:hypothetical protein [Streptomyces sp. CBMA152]|uniref:hypothetical protein n=1 Tax=Streptomyces sp. CBMA152 TaxID=1896312 RepID=UPI0016606C19|nr:hypothetical protein [Streptomyces sp. CBMA152]MBD0742946.1 hypothetical protein [Streptomyces sp. CBMA152]